MLECAWCREAGVKRWYIGETSRSLYTRGAEHLEAVDAGEVGHPLVRHGWEDHKGVKPPFLMRVVSRHKNALDRLTREAVMIVDLSRGPEEEDLNAKSEWGQARVPRMTVYMPQSRRPAEPENPEMVNPFLAQYEKVIEGKGRGRPGAQGPRGGKIRLRMVWNPPQGEDEAICDGDIQGQNQEQGRFFQCQNTDKRRRRQTETEPTTQTAPVPAQEHGADPGPAKKRNHQNQHRITGSGSNPNIEPEEQPTAPTAPITPTTDPVGTKDRNAPRLSTGPEPIQEPGPESDPGPVRFVSTDIRYREGGARPKTKTVINITRQCGNPGAGLTQTQ